MVINTFINIRNIQSELERVSELLFNAVWAYGRLKPILIEWVMMFVCFD